MGYCPSIVKAPAEMPNRMGGRVVRRLQAALPYPKA